ncbi:FMN-binding negative transcriptional regulator [Cytobacillus sp. Sa5YUA1]|uniref:FMN-binding negative transcriptional regulator n=1 Tax=Cytobacillus stercorigallinarum TaxID=2762240 RepID=A0ABR8QTY2_9BACI|nr:FMN-binding negative transcriptional regulator [Cytobacillus stercorigallinarum]MBD7939006.1 FMN-binding negative transcriptional regulator [Cytobacillus stercorigallinarum]
MYIPSYFKITDETLAYDIMREYSFATLFSQHNGMPFATHLPLILSKDNQYLYGHFARQNPQWKDIENQSVLAIFHGPHCYISPSWYETNKAVPTWNYVTVHAYGEVEKIEDKNELMDSFHEMVLKYESPDSTYNLQDVDSGFIAGQKKGVQGFKIKINEIEGKAKLSQNHPVQRQEKVISQLEKESKTDEQQIALLMKANLKTGNLLS